MAEAEFDRVRREREDSEGGGRVAFEPVSIPSASRSPLQRKMTITTTQNSNLAESTVETPGA